MTTFDTERAAKGWALIAEGAMEISLAYSAIATPSSEAARPGSAGASVPSPSRSADPVPSFDDLPPEGWDEPAPLKPQVDAGLGMCPTHGTAWTIKAGGVSKAGKPYKAFWKCSQKDGDTFCDKKPQPIWAQTHPAEAVA